MKMAEYAESLARTYLNRGERSRDWKDYLKAHGLANYCVAADPTPEKCRLVYDIEVSWYQGNHPISFEEHQKLTNQHKQELRAYRDGVKADFKPLDALGMLLDADDVYSTENMTRAEQFCDNLFELSRKGSDEFIIVTKKIIESSVELLKRINRDPPCDFAVIGLGSVAKGEATPYSDVEYAFIVERDDKEYFEMLAMESYFRIGNLGETPLKCFNIKELKVDKLFPSVIPEIKTAGFRIDGISKSAGNIPTGNGLEGGQPLTFTVDSLMNLYKTSAQSPFDGMAGDKSDMLSSTVVIYTNEGDQSQLYNQFIKERMAYELNVAQNSIDVNEKRTQSFVKDIQTFTFAPEFIKYQPPQNMSIKVKSDIFRYPTLLANNIKMFMGWNERYPWQIFSKLQSLGYIAGETHLHTRIVLALSIYMRSRAYLHQRSQTEYVSLVPQLAESMKNLYQVPSSLFVVLGCFLVPLKRSVKSAVQNMPSIAENASLADAIIAMLRSIKCGANGHMSKIEICYFAGEYKLASKELSKVLEADLDSIKPAEFLEKVFSPADCHSANNGMALCCYVLYHTGFYAAAAGCFSWLIGNVPGNIGFWKLLLAHCKKETGDYRATREVINEAKHCLDQSYGFHSTDSEKPSHAQGSNHRDISNSYRDIGSVYEVLGEYKEAMKYYKQALKMDEEMFGETVHPDIAADYHNVGCAHIGLGEYATASNRLNKSLNMRKHIHGVNNNQPDTAKSYHKIAITYGARGDHTKALQYNHKSLAMKISIYGADSNHPEIAMSYNNIGNICRDQGDYTLALAYHKKSLEMRTADSSHRDLALSHNNIAIAYNDRGDHTLALEHYNESLKLRKSMYGADANHPDIATIYNNIALVHRDCGHHKLALEYHSKSLAMKEAIYGAKTNHPDIATSYNNIGIVHRDCSEHALALDYFTKSLEMVKDIYGADSNHSDIVMGYNNIAVVLKDQGDHTTALKYHVKSLEMMKVMYGADSNHADIASSYNNIALIHRECGDHMLALEYYTRSLEMRRASYGADSDHPFIADSYNNIAVVYKECGAHTLALEYYAKSLEMRKGIFGANTDHPDIAASYSNIAMVYSGQGNHALALNCLNKSLEVRKKIYGSNANHPDIASSYHNMVVVYRNNGSITLALEYCNKSVEIRKAIYSADTNHPDIAMGYNNIAVLYSDCGDHKSALDYYNQSVEMRKVIYGGECDHPYIANSYNNIAGVYRDHGDYTLAVEYYHKSLLMMLNRHGEDPHHPFIVACKQNIADTLQMRENSS